MLNKAYYISCFYLHYCSPIRNNRAATPVLSLSPAVISFFALQNIMLLIFFYILTNNSNIKNSNYISEIIIIACDAWDDLISHALLMLLYIVGLRRVAMFLLTRTCNIYVYIYIYCVFLASSIYLTIIF